MRACRFVWLLLVLAVPGLAQKKPAEVYTDPDKAGPDVKIQGEYVGENSQQRKWGAQVVAEGDGKFMMRALAGGLPGEGWDGSTEHKFTGKRVTGKVTFEGDVATGEIGGGTVTATVRDSGDIVNLKRVVRRSPTEGLKPPPGAVVLFAGTSAVTTIEQTVALTS